MFHSSKEAFLQTFRQFSENWILTKNPQPQTLQKWWKFCTISKCAKKIVFGHIICSTHQKKCFYKLLGCFKKIEFFDGKFTAMIPYKKGKNLLLSQNVLRKYFLAKFFVPLIKRNVSTKFKAGFGKLNFWRKIHSRGPCKNGENFVLSQNELRKHFLATLFVPLIKRSVSTIFKAVFWKLNFWQKIHSRGPYKNGENFVLSQNLLRKYFLATLFVPLIRRSFSTNFQAVFGKLNFWRKIHSRVPLQKWWKFCTISKCIQNVLRKYFSAKLFVPLIKRSVSTIFKAVLGKLNFWQKIHSRDPYKNGENLLLSQNVLRKYFLATLLVPLIKRSVSTTFKAVCGKLNCWQKIHSRGPYKNGENFVLSQNVLRKYFLAKFFVPLIKRNVSTNFKAAFGKLNFWRKIHSRGPYKNGENFVLSQNVLRKYFLAKFFVPLIKRSVSTNFKAVFGKLNFWQKIHSRGPYKHGENFVLFQNVLRKYFLAKFFVPLIKRSVSTNF